jgi:selenocysteine-specific elongation factor
MIVGTAGHIDHGKTSLVRALTGVETDRLKEEKERGISIELGYAYTALSNGDVLGFVDVPGHERLVHTMVAGACGIDFALLVVAADDGVMPQTREHLVIVELLGISRGAVALTKTDRVDCARLQQAEVEVRLALRDTVLRDVPIFPVDGTAADHPGVSALREYLHDAARQMPARDVEGLFRLAVDRVFTLAGHGTVVTGTVFSGQVRIADTLTLMPANLPVRVRSIHTQNRPSDRGCAGQRCALNIVGVEKNAISRGDWLAASGGLTTTARVDVHLRLLAGGGSSLTTWSPIHVHIGATHRVAHVVMLESQRLSAGEVARVQLVFDAPICALPGDRFIVRDARASHTIGGGHVLDPYAPARKRRSDERWRYLDAIQSLVSGEGISPLLQNARFGVKRSKLASLSGRAPNRMRLPADAMAIGSGEECFVILVNEWRVLRERVLTSLQDFHGSVPDELGPDAGRLRRMAFHDMPQALWRALLDELANEGAVLRNGPWLHLPQHSVTLCDSDQPLAKQLHSLISDGGADPPWVRELATTLGEPEQRVRQILCKCGMQGALYQVVHDLFYDKHEIDELAATIAELAREQGGVNAARFRDAIGLGRKRTIQILEFFDRIGYTRRVHDVHVLRTDSGWEWKAHAPGGTAGLQIQQGASDASW